MVFKTFVDLHYYINMRNIYNYYAFDKIFPMNKTNFMLDIDNLYVYLSMNISCGSYIYSVNINILI